MSPAEFAQLRRENDRMAERILRRCGEIIGREWGVSPEDAIEACRQLPEGTVEQRRRRARKLAKGAADE